MALTDIAPFLRSPNSKEITSKPSAIADASHSKGFGKLFKVVSLALGFNSMPYGRRTAFEESPYDLQQIINAIDTDSFVKQGFAKYQELFWKEGWDLVGENETAVDFLRERMDFMEIAMRKSIDDFLFEVTDQLIKFGNAYIAKSRGDLSPFFSGRLKTFDDKDPIIGYYVVPAETMEIRRNKNNKVLRYRQRVDTRLSGFRGSNGPSWSPEEMIHLTVDKKPGRAFGTPFIIAAIDDIIALRQLEEDIQNLVHKELFPLYKYTVGTDTHPAEDDEIDAAAVELANLRTDGGLVLPERHDVDVIGANGTSLDASGYLRHFLIRVCSGLGLSPHHLGIMDESGNRAVTDRLDIALYDRVKRYQRYFEDMIRITIFTELLIEGGFDPITHPLNAGQSDRCEFRFREIDVDTQTKKENHVMQKWTNNVITFDEVRLELGYDPVVDENQLQQAVMTRLMPDPAPAGGASGTPSKPDAQKPSTGGRPNTPNSNRGVGNRSRPANQFGRSPSSNIRHSDDWLNSVVELLDEDDSIDGNDDTIQ